MIKKLAIFLLPLATLLCTLQFLVAAAGADHHGPPSEKVFVNGCVAALAVTTILLWLRFRWTLPFAVAAYFVFGTYQAWELYRTIRSENYSGPAVLVLLLLIGLCPFLAALVAAAWGGEFCERTKHEG